MHPLAEELNGAVGDVAARFDRARVGRELGEKAAAQIPHLAARRDPELLEETVLAATSNVVAIMDGLIAGTAPQAIPVPSVSLRWADGLVSRNIDLSTVPWAYSFGNTKMTDALQEVVRELDLSGEQRWELSQGLTSYVQTYVETICAQMVDHFVECESRWRSGLPAHRRALVSQLLAGEALAVEATSRELGYDLRGTHLAAVVWPANGVHRPSEAELERAAQSLLRSCGADQVLVIPHPDGSAWAWGGGSGITDRLGDRPFADLDLLGALGTVASGPAGFVASHEDAQRARRVAGLLAKRPRSIVPYRSVALTALVAQDPQQALRFVESELGPLTEDTDSARRLRATLAVYLEEGLRPVRAARRLGVHQNTVAYRVAQAEEAIGRALTERRLELETALRLAEALEGLRASGGPRD